MNKNIDIFVLYFHNMEQRFLEVASNPTVSDEDLFEELCYLQASSLIHSNERTIFFERFKHIRRTNPTLQPNVGPEERLELQIRQAAREDARLYYVEKYEMNKRIKYLEQTVAALIAQVNATEKNREQEATV
jgi:hypothetical protein